MVKGKIAVSEILARAESLGTTTDCPVKIIRLNDADADMLRLGMVRRATLYADNASAIGVLASISSFCRPVLFIYFDGCPVLSGVIQL